MEVTGLHLTAAEWLSLLSLRTSGAALDIVKRAQNMGITDPQAGVEFIWEQFQRKFENRTAEAQKVLKELQNFPEVT